MAAILENGDPLVYYSKKFVFCMVENIYFDPNINKIGSVSKMLW